MDATDERMTETASMRRGASLRRAFLHAAVLVAALFAAFASASQSSAAGIGDFLAATARGERATPVVGRKSEEVLLLSGWSIGGDEARTVVTFDLSHAAHVRLFTTVSPTRLVVDLPSARFDRGEPASAARGLVAGWRFGAHASGRSRLVVDTRGPVRLARAEVDRATPSGLPRLVVELVPASPEEMRAAATVDLPADPVGAGPAPKADRGAVATTADRPRGARPVVVIDAGHGGNDAGTVSPATGTPEKTVVLAMSKVLARQLRETGRYEVVTTRETDGFLGLGERVRIARTARADLFLSIHADAEYDHSVRGATVYTLAEKASDEQAAALAAKENQSDALAGHVAEAAETEVADILADLTVRETRRLSHVLARDILEEYARHGRLVKSQPHRQAGLKVLRAHDIPSALVELGFLSNKEDEALLTSPEWRERTASALVAAIDRWFAGRDALAGTTR